MVNLIELVISLISLLIPMIYCNEDAKRLHDDLMANYNKHRRPAPAANKPITIKLKLRLSQIIDVHEIDQIMTCSVWLKQVWIDKKLSWNPKNYGGVSVLADSNYNITISTKATLRYDGEVTWEPPAIFKSLCQIDFGSWTYSEKLLNLELLGGEPHYELEINANGEVDNVTIVEDGIDLSDYYPSVEWDIISRVAKRRTKNYASCCLDETYADIMYYLELRRKPLFYTVNLVFPCVGISFLTILVFYLPSHSGEKVTLCISILVALTVFYLLLTEIIPATSISLPLIGKYLLFTMVMVTLSVIVTVISLNLHFRKPTTHRMPEWVKWFFLKTLPKILFMRQPLNGANDLFCKDGKRSGELFNVIGERITMNYHEHTVNKSGRNPIRTEPDERIQKLYHSPNVVKAFENICFIAELLKKKDQDAKNKFQPIEVDEDWKCVAMVLDRLFLLLFSIACFAGTITILLQAPTLHDTRKAIDLQYRPTNIT
ncbi:Cation transporter family protein [Onchocerca flexuosa]|uniref:Cation transporter family protein n=1 Tax=Onchocerca flexuosa TaxID=387005 RepID=A0A238C689_9BILA|nr:Cation transporter family protein [Onchocerca flexuosa]